MASFLSDKVFTVEELADTATQILGGEVKGSDTDGREYASLHELWESERVRSTTARTSSGEAAPEPAQGTSAAAGEEKPQQAWYSQAFDYWEVLRDLHDAWAFS
jgi:hypothetical protein